MSFLEASSQSSIVSGFCLAFSIVLAVLVSCADNDVLPVQPQLDNTETSTLSEYELQIAFGAFIHDTLGMCNTFTTKEEFEM